MRTMEHERRPRKAKRRIHNDLANDAPSTPAPAEGLPEVPLAPSPITTTKKPCRKRNTPRPAESNDPQRPAPRRRRNRHDDLIQPIQHKSRPF